MNEKRKKEIENELESLPIGKLTYKTIKGKKQPYLQYSKNGKTVSIYVKKGEREEILRLLAYREHLLKELNELD